jgi:uncharacterized membrane protein
MFENIPANQQQVIQFKAKAGQVGTQMCQLYVETKETASRQMTLQTDVRGRADLSIRVMDSGDAVGVGSKTDFNVEITNVGSQVAEQVELQIELPAGLMPVNQPGYAIDPTGNNITFNSMKIEPGETKKLQFKVVAVNEGEHVVRATVSMDGSNSTISSEDSVFVFEAENAKVSEALVPELRR